jgi:hypothetical protein
MTASQLAAIEGMGLTAEDMQTWMKERGIEIPSSASGQGGAGAGAPNMSEDERAAMREEMQNMTDEERATRLAELGIERPEGEEGARPAGTGGGARQSNIVLGPLVELLAARAAG